MIIPNSEIGSEIVTNSSIVDEAVCNIVEMGISYNSDINKAMSIMKEEAIPHPNFYDNRTAADKKAGIEPVMTRVISLGDSSITLRAYVWTEDHTEGFDLKTDL